MWRGSLDGIMTIVRSIKHVSCLIVKKSLKKCSPFQQTLLTAKLGSITEFIVNVETVFVFVYLCIRKIFVHFKLLIILNKLHVFIN